MVRITIGYPTRKPLVPGKRGPTRLELAVLRRVFHGQTIYAPGTAPRTWSQAAARCRRLGLLEADEKSSSGLRLTRAGRAAIEEYGPGKHVS